MRDRLLLVLAGTLLILMFFGLGQTSVGLDVVFVTPWNASSASELYFLLGIVFFVFPGMVLVALGAQGLVRSRVESLWARLARLEGKDALAPFVGVFAAALLIAVVGNALVFHGLPFTDDEYAVQFGGQLMASGRVMQEIPPYMEALPRLFLWARDGMVTSFDFPGAQLPWAVSELTGTGTLVFSILAALAAATVGALVARKLSPAWGVLAALVFMVSPMAATLSMTSHTHLVSRCFLAAALLAWVVARDRGDLRSWALVGFLAGCAGATRPLEITLFLGPLIVSLIYDVPKKRPSASTALAGFALGAAGPVALFFAHCYGVTGTWLPPRLVPSEFERIATGGDYYPPLTILSQPWLFWHRFGSNLSYNAFMLLIWSFGPLTLLLVAVGSRVSRFAALLTAGVACTLLLALLHDNDGLHIVGPIHYSDAAVPLSVVAVLGLERIHRWMGEHASEARRWFGPVAAGHLVALAFMTSFYTLALERQARVESLIYGMFDDPKYDNALVLAPVHGQFRLEHPGLRGPGGFIFDWRKVRPDETERVIIVHKEMSEETMRALAHRFGDRRWYELSNLRAAPYFAVVPIVPGRQ